MHNAFHNFHRGGPFKLHNLAAAIQCHTNLELYTVTLQ